MDIKLFHVLLVFEVIVPKTYFSAFVLTILESNIFPKMMPCTILILFKTSTNCLLIGVNPHHYVKLRQGLC